MVAVVLQNQGITDNDGESASPPPEPGTPADLDEHKIGKGDFYARIHIRDDMVGINRFFLEVKTWPVSDTSRWPGLQNLPNEWYNNDGHVKAVVTIRNTSVPQLMPAFSRPTTMVEIERRRYDKGIHYSWDMLNNADYIILRNPESLRIEDSGYSIPQLISDVFVSLGGNVLDLAVMLENTGHAKISTKEWDWGTPFPKELK